MGLIKKAIIAGTVYSILKRKKKTEEQDIPQKKEELRTEIQVPKTDVMASNSSATKDFIFATLLCVFITVLVAVLVKSRRR